MVELGATCAMSYISMTNKAFLLFQLTNAWLIYLSLIGLVVSMLVLFLTESSKRVPDNFVWLGIFTLCESYLTSIITGTTNEILVLEALFLTLSIVIALTLYAYFTDKDFSVAYGMVAITSVSLLSLCLLNIFIRSDMMENLILFVQLIVSGLYIVIDTQVILNKCKRSMDIDNYVVGSLYLYTDIVSLFLKILEVLIKISGKDKKK